MKDTTAKLFINFFFSTFFVLGIATFSYANEKEDLVTGWIEVGVILDGKNITNSRSKNFSGKTLLEIISTDKMTYYGTTDFLSSVRSNPSSIREAIDTVCPNAEFKVNSAKLFYEKETNFNNIIYPGRYPPEPGMVVYLNISINKSYLASNNPSLRCLRW